MNTVTPPRSLTRSAKVQPWCVLDATAPQPVFRCKHCLSEQLVDLPADLGMMAVKVLPFHPFDSKRVEPKRSHDQSPDVRLPHRLYARARRPPGPCLPAGRRADRGHPPHAVSELLVRAVVAS